MSFDASRWAGAVLCGGASSRMGRDKALLGPPERPLAVRVRDAIVASGVDDVVFVGGDGGRLATHGAWVPDDDPGAGPLSALATFHRLRPDRAVIVGACDLPQLTGDACRALVRVVDAGAAVAVPMVDGRPAWSCVAVSAVAARSASDAVAGGVRSMHRGLGALDDVVYLDLPGSAYRDVDDPGELAEFADW